jgi:uncharacterized Zn finger protein
MNAINIGQTRIEQYVTAAAAAQGLELDKEQLQRVAAAFARNADIARLVLEFELPESVEPAPVFQP